MNKTIDGKTIDRLVEYATIGDINGFRSIIEDGNRFIIYEIIDRKIIHNAYVNGKFYNGNSQAHDGVFESKLTLIHIASLHGQFDIVEYLLSLDKNLMHLKCKHADFKPIYFACQFGSRKIVKLFIDNGFDKNDVDNSNKHTPLQTACYWGRLDVVKYLLSIGASKDDAIRYPYYGTDIDEIKKLLQI